MYPLATSDARQDKWYNNSMMRNNLRRLLHHTLGYGVGMAISRFAGVILVPIYTRVLSPAEYGAWGAVNTIATILGLVVFLGLDTALSIMFFENQEPDAQRRVIGATFWTVMAWTLGLVGVGQAIAPMLAEQVLGQRLYEPFLRISLLTIPFTMIHAMQLQILRLRFALARYNALALGNLVLGAGMSVLLAAGFGYGLWGIFIGVLSGYMITGLLGWWLNRAEIGPWSRPLLGPMLALGLPLVPASLGYWMMSYADRWFLIRAVVPHELGLYEVANRLTSGIALFTVTFQAAWSPFALSIEQHAGAQRTYAKSLTYYTIFALGGALALGLFAREALIIFTPPDYHAAFPAVALLVYGPVAAGAYTIIATGASLSKKTAPIAVTMVIAGLINLALNLLLITWAGWGILGAALATGVAFLLSTALLYRAAQRVYPIPYETAKVLRILLIQATLMASLLASMQLNYWPGLVLRIAALVAFPPLLWLAGCFEEWELKLLARAIRQPRTLINWVGGRSQ